MKVKPGKLITLEGGEGAGKSTQLTRLAAALERGGLSVVTTREPGGSPAGERIRKLLVEGEPGSLAPMTEALLHFAQRAEHIEKTIQPALERGSWVVCDRFADSTMAYQGYGHGLGRDACERAHRLALGDLVPDLTLILDVPPALGLERAGRRRGAENRYERMELAFHQRIRAGFLEIARLAPERCRVIDARDAIADVAAAVRRAVAERFALAL